MMRGSIEVAHRNRVAGWIYSSSDTVRDKLIMAFVGVRCVGAGKVDRFRKDLLEAGLGDGFCGYDFPIVLEAGENLGAVVIRLQNADAALIQSNTRLIGPDDAADDDTPDLGTLSPANVTWMQDRGWLDQPEYDFLKAVQNIGAYERGLRPPRRAGGDTPPATEPGAMVADLLSIYMLGEVDVARHAVTGLSDLGTATSPLRQSAVSVVAIWSPDRGRICIDERSHLGARPERGQVLQAAPAGGIDYRFGPDRLLFLHKDLSFAPQGPAPAGGIAIFTAALRAARRQGGKAAQTQAA